MSCASKIEVWNLSLLEDLVLSPTEVAWLLRMSMDWGQLDCLGEIKGLGGYEECLAQSEGVDLDGTEVRVLTLDALITAKRAMGRPRDLHAVLELEAIRRNLWNN